MENREDKDTELEYLRDVVLPEGLPPGGYILIYNGYQWEWHHPDWPHLRHVVESIEHEQREKTQNKIRHTTQSPK